MIPVQDEFKYRAVISYSHSDEAWARWLHKSLETYRIPKHLVGRDTQFGPVPERLAPVFRDREELASATSLGASTTSCVVVPDVRATLVRAASTCRLRMTSCACSSRASLAR